MLIYYWTIYNVLILRRIVSAIRAIAVFFDFYFWFDELWFGGQLPYDILDGQSAVKPLVLVVRLQGACFTGLIASSP